MLERLFKHPLLLGFLWMAAVAKGMTVLWTYQHTPGPVSVAAPEWPRASHLPRPLGMPALVMAVHPHCPCSRASVGELALLMARLHGRVTGYVLVYKPKAFADAWAKTDLWTEAARIPGVRVVRDDEGAEAQRFGAATSGATFVYDGEGRLMFSGGITPSRGHWGDNPGFHMVIKQLTARVQTTFHAPVYGCALMAKESAWKR